MTLARHSEAMKEAAGPLNPDSARSMLSLEFVGLRSRVDAPVMQEEVTVSADRLLAVKEAAA